MDWMEQAVCKSVDPTLFMPDGGAAAVVGKYRKAISICNNCPVITECGQYALSLAREHQLFGVWGGMTAKEINDKARRMRAA